MPKELPKISIVTPSYNQATFLEAAIQSVLSQNYPNLEYIIIDGGSTDGSIEIIEKYQEHLHFWCSEPDAGQYDAINKGFSHSTGKIMAWLNSDDMFCPWAFATVSSIMSDLPQVKWLTTLQPGGWDHQGFCTGFGTVSGFSREAFLDGCYLPGRKQTIAWIQQESTFWERSLWEKIGCSISTEFKLAGDFDLWSRFFENEDLYSTISPLGGFRTQINQRSRRIDSYLVEAEHSLSTLQEKFGWSPKIYRSRILDLKLNKIPKVRSMITSVFGYTGKKIARENFDSPDGLWTLEEYKFFPR